MIGGPALVCTACGYTALSAGRIWNFNYFGHGGAADRRRDGSDFHRANLSRNHGRPGFVRSE